MRNSKWVVFVGAGVPGLSLAEISTLEESYWSEQDDAETKLECDLVESFSVLNVVLVGAFTDCCRWN